MDAMDVKPVIKNKLVDQASPRIDLRQTETAAHSKWLSPYSVPETEQFMQECD